MIEMEEEPSESEVRSTLVRLVVISSDSKVPRLGDTSGHAYLGHRKIIDIDIKRRDRKIKRRIQIGSSCGSYWGSSWKES